MIREYPNYLLKEKDIAKEESDRFINFISSTNNLWVSKSMYKKWNFYNSIEETGISEFDTIICLDVLEHLSDPADQLNIFHEAMNYQSTALFNWYFYKGDSGEYPFHIDDEKIVKKFFETLQSKYLEVFHPILITTRAYKKY